ncbi:hypothetical protein GL279_00415 [Paracoccus limosus]|uniref:Uncharacterized protein n=1 Tax=Paracoccus limosus TaxID=913252 RepID=A0A844H1D1_9RHOB|nr:hypothetical protein [Paracoccus limosus]MTH33061.1 hypothetical protein [Paracoccus limosus]
MKLTPLLANQPATANGDAASLELVLVLQQLVAVVKAQEDEIAALTARVEALEP